MAIVPTLAPAAHQFAISEHLVKASLEGLDASELFRSPDNLNHMLWLFGHLANTRLGLLNLLGRPKQRPWNDIFGRGSTLRREDYPSLDQVRECWDDVVAESAARLETITAEELVQPSSRDFPIADKSVLGAAVFLAFHEAYHAGQMAMLRKWLGKGQLVG